MCAERTLNPPLFRALIKIYNQACNGNFSQAARLLGVSRLTYIRWQDDIPPSGQHYWPTIIAQAIQDVLREWRKQSSTRIRSRAVLLGQEYNKLMRDHDQQAGEIDITYTANAKQYLLSLFREHEEVSTRKLRQDGRYSMRTLREAAVDLQLIKRTEGFGEDKETFYTLPEDDDNEN